MIRAGRDLLALFDVCCSAEATPAPKSSWKGKGWKLIKRDAADPLTQRWLAVCDNAAEGFVSSRRVKEADWARLLGVAEPVECDLASNGKSTLGIRFRCGKPRADQMRVNEEIRQPPEPPPSASEPLTPPPPENIGPTGITAVPTVGAANGASRPSKEITSPVGLSPAVSRGSPATVELLLGHGSADDPVFIDLETRSACDLKKEGGRHYAQHPSTEILTAVALIDDQVVVWTPTLDTPLPAEGLWPDGYGLGPLAINCFAGPTLPPPLGAAILAGRVFCAHNAWNFDMRVWRAKGLPEPVEWHDTMPHVRAAGLPGGLDELGERLFGRGKDKKGAALIEKLRSPNRRGEFVPFTPKRAQHAARYNLVDVLLLARVFPVTFGCGEPDIIALDRVINERGIAFDDELARALIALESAQVGSLKAEVERLTDGVIKADDLRRPKLLTDWLNLHGVHLPNLQHDTILAYLEGAVDPVVRQVLEARLAANRITTSKLGNALVARDPDGRLRDLLVYHNAHTGRWTGRGAQPHNLPRPHPDLKDSQALLETVKDPDRFWALLPTTVSAADALSALVRPCYRAPTGMRLLIGDFAGIEARGTAWCANEGGLLARFARGEDVYLGLAARVFGRPMTSQDKMERQVGKQGILGCGYSMGARKFASTCAMRGVDLAAAGTSAEAVVEGYRDAYPAIAGTEVTANGRTWRRGGLWKDVEAAARGTIQTGFSREAGRCTFLMDGTTMLIRLPSGRTLRYCNARIENCVPGYCRDLGLPEVAKPTVVFDGPKHRNEQTYGGKLTENIVQAISRDLLVAAMLECERQGLPVVLHVHDEIVNEVPQEEAVDALRRQAIIMSTPPAWASGFPIEVECFATQRYMKSVPKGAPFFKARDGVIL